MDEIDLFLHPEWQRLVIGEVARSFPRLQFLFSTHSPLVAGTLEAANLYMLITDSNGDAAVEQYREEVQGMTANQVLTSSYFGLHSTRAPDTGTLSEQAEREIAAEVVAGGTSEVEVTSLPAVEKERLARLMEQARQREQRFFGEEI